MEFRFLKKYEKSAITYLPNDVFYKRWRIVGNEILNFAGGIEGTLFLKEITYREKFDDLFLKNLIICDYNELEEEVTSWLNCGVRPEHINIATKIFFDTYINEANLHKYYSEEELIELHSDIDRIVLLFNKSCGELFDCEYIDYKFIEEKYNQFKPTGLGFSLITSSTSNALLYQAMNAREVNKQITQNIYEKNQLINEYVSEKAEERFNELLKIYETFSSDLINNIEKSLKLLEEMKKKCSKKDLKNEEIQKELRHKQNEEKNIKLLEELKKADKLYAELLKEKESPALKEKRKMAFAVIFPLNLMWVFLSIVIPSPLMFCSLLASIIITVILFKKL